MAATHFTDIGFDVTRWQDMHTLIGPAAEAGDRIETPDGPYVLWSVGAGIEIWVQVGEDDQALGVHPHFRGPARMRASVAGILPGNGNPLDGSLYCWADPQTDDLEAGLYPFVATAPDFGLVRAMTVPRLATLQVAAFAHHLACTPEPQFRGEQGLWGPQAFIPSGLFEVKGMLRRPRLRDRPLPEAILSGRISEAQVVANPATGREFHALVVRTLGGDVDVVADPAVVDGEPVRGAIAQGEFWLSASVQD